MAQKKFIMAGFSPIQIPGGHTLTNSLIKVLGFSTREGRYAKDNFLYTSDIGRGTRTATTDS